MLQRTSTVSCHPGRSSLRAYRHLRDFPDDQVKGLLDEARFDPVHCEIPSCHRGSICEVLFRSRLGSTAASRTSEHHTLRILYFVSPNILSRPMTTYQAQRLDTCTATLCQKDLALSVQRSKPDCRMLAISGSILGPLHRDQGPAVWRFLACQDVDPLQSTSQSDVASLIMVSRPLDYCSSNRAHLESLCMSNCDMPTRNSSSSN